MISSLYTPVRECHTKPCPIASRSTRPIKPIITACTRLLKPISEQKMGQKNLHFVKQKRSMESKNLHWRDLSKPPIRQRKPKLPPNLEAVVDEDDMEDDEGDETWVR